MDNDAKLLAMDDKQLGRLMGDVLRLWKEGEDLAQCLLAHSSLVYDCLLTDELPTPHILALGVQAFLRWAVDQLGPTRNSNQSEDGQREFASLYYPYVERKTFKEVADAMAIDEQTVYDWRLKALAKLVNTLRRELAQPQQRLQRKHYAVAERYRFYQPEPLGQADEQRLLRFCSLLRQPVPVQALHELALSLTSADARICIDRLLLDGWLVQAGEKLTTMLRDEDARTYLGNRLTRAERQDWYSRLAEISEKQGNYLDAARNWSTAEHYQAAATTLIEHYRAIVDAGQIKQLYELQTQFTAVTLDRNTLARLHIAVGRAALVVENIKRAIEFLQEALRVPDSLLKAEAYYYLGKAFESVRFEEADRHFNRGIQLLETMPVAHNEQSTALLADLYVGKAWLYILLAPQPAAAADVLRRAQVLIVKHDSGRWSSLNRAWVNLHNALAGLCALQNNAEGELEHYHQAVMAAREVGDNELLWKPLHNLAQTYIHAQRYQPGLEYLDQACEVATALQNDEWLGKCAQTRGAAYYYQGQSTEMIGHGRAGAAKYYVQAIEHYHTAAAVFQKTGNDHWLAAAYADLAEAYVALPNLLQARQHYIDAIICARRANTEDVVLQVLNKLAEAHPELALKDLMPRHLKVLEIAQQRGVMTRKALEEQPDFTYASIRHDLNKLVDLGLLLRIGQGSGSKYVLPDRTGFDADRVK